MKHPNKWSIRKHYESIKETFFGLNFKEYAILAKAFSFLLAYLQRDLTWSSNVRLLSICIPRNVRLRFEKTTVGGGHSAYISVSFLC